MTSKWDMVQAGFERSHDNLFSGEYDAEFINTSQGTRDNKADTFTGETETSLGTIQVEQVPPGMDTTVQNTGTSVSWDTSIRFPIDDKPGELKPLGEDNERPTKVVLSDPVDGGSDTFELHGYTYEKGSNMVLCRLVEQ